MKDIESAHAARAGKANHRERVQHIQALREEPTETVLTKPVKDFLTVGPKPEEEKEETRWARYAAETCNQSELDELIDKLDTMPLNKARGGRRAADEGSPPRRHAESIHKAPTRLPQGTPQVLSRYA